MTETDILALVERFGAAWDAHDLDAAMAMMTDDCVFEATGPAPDGARHEGRDAVAEAWRPIFEDAEASFTVEQLFAAGDDRAVQLWRYDWDGGHVRGIDVFTTRDGRIAAKLSYVKG